jgi:hypothetical protein
LKIVCLKCLVGLRSKTLALAYTGCEPIVNDTCTFYRKFGKRYAQVLYKCIFRNNGSLNFHYSTVEYVLGKGLNN